MSDDRRTCAKCGKDLFFRPGDDVWQPRKLHVCEKKADEQTVDHEEE